MDIKITEQADNLLKDNGVRKEEILDIIKNSESSGQKLKSKDGNTCIAKGASENLTIYAVYSASELLDVYTHKMNILGITGGEIKPVEYDDASDWICAKCGEVALERNVDMSYLGVTRPGPGLVCAKCGEMYVSAGMAKSTLKTAEAILEEKRA
ncbi:hypothetical protein [Methanolobus sp.]|uniref:DUF7479 domain-containing protein n=1 Tax=Methanolobus sp. TaxID=1874737 RepID=UPI0025FA0E66|nr:hypothetical protein [Methanolobus sp.]